MKREPGFTANCDYQVDGLYLANVQCSNVAIIFYKTQQVLTMIPISALQNSVAQLRDIISGMKLFLGDTKFIFVQENMIIAIEDVAFLFCLYVQEKKIPAISILREYSFPFPFNCNRCIFIHIRPQVL